MKYAGYVARQAVEVERQQRLAEKRIPAGFDFAQIAHLRAEAREKLSRVRPHSLAQASRISGITPADLALLMVHLEVEKRSSVRSATVGGSQLRDYGSRRLWQVWTRAGKRKSHEVRVETA